MRTPWRFVADLVSRKPKADRSEAATSIPDEIKALEYHPAGGAPTEALDGRAADQPGPAVPEDDPQPFALPGEVPHPQTDALVVSPAEIGAGEPIESTPISSADTADEAATEIPRRAPKKTTRSVLPELSRRSEDREPPAAFDGVKTLVDEMTELDLEVVSLRRELAKRLNEQNAQLRRMLARFDAR